jgi:hypothetical protein
MSFPPRCYYCRRVIRWLLGLRIFPGSTALHVARLPCLGARSSETEAVDFVTVAIRRGSRGHSLQEPACSVSPSDIAVSQLNRNKASMNPIMEPTTRPVMKYTTEPHALVRVESTPLASEPMLLPNTR